MKNELEKLKAQQAEMLTKIHEMNAALEAITVEDETDGNEAVYTFTKEEMVKFILEYHSAFSDATEQTIKDMDLNDSGYYDLSLYGNQIEVDIDNYAIAKDIINEIDMDDDDESILGTVNSVYDRVKKKD